MNLESLKSKLRKIKLLIMDVDGTLTDGSMYYSDDGKVTKRFYTRDGMGINLLRKGDIEAAIITSENSDIVVNRAKKLKIDNYVLGSRNKTQDFKDLIEKMGFNAEETAYIGDDVNDFHAMQLAGVSACPSDAVFSVKDVADVICDNKGGNGAVREFCEMILNAQNKPITLDENW
jgi:YrbI family 3-deoxy-D-manno-octulosonate 8-phosphate phosphatase